MKPGSNIINSDMLAKRVILGVLVFFMSVSLYSQAPTNGLILHYTFDKIDGTSIPDSSGNSNAGTLQGAAATVEGHLKQGVQCPTRNDYIRLPANFTTSLTSFSFMTWVKLNSLKNATRFFDLGNGADGSNNFLAFIPSYNGDNNYITLRYRPASGTAYNVISSVKCPVGAWAHIALTFDWNSSTSTSTVTIYIDGTAVATTGSNTMPINPSTLGNTADNYLGHSRWGQDNNGFDGIFDDVRFYNRTLTASEVENSAYPAELNTQWHALSLGNLSNVKANISLPATMGGVSIAWESSKPGVITTDGTVNRPVQFDAKVSLTATLSYSDAGVLVTRKKVFDATVVATNPSDELLARWNFAKDKISESGGEIKITDATASGFVGTLKDVASIRTMGKTKQFNVLDLGNNKGHFDMGTQIGEIIYYLTDYTMSAYFRIDTAYKQLTSNGNFIWTFSNAEDQEATRNGYLIGRVNVLGQSISTNHYTTGNQAVLVGSPATQGTWHHLAYTQQGDSGKVFVDGILKAKGRMTNVPSVMFANNGLTGTPFNWIGRSCYESRGDVYLRQTLVYDFRLYRIAISQDDFRDNLNITSVLDSLNRAYAEQPYDTLPELKTEMKNLTLGDMSAVTSDITLPAAGTLDPSIKITWISALPAIVSNDGVITQYDYINHKVILTAVLSKGGQRVMKDFEVNVLAKSGTGYTSDLILSYSFTDDKVSAPTVTDAAEKGFTGTLMKGASVITMGKADNKHNVLNLAGDSAYFDMGADCGKLIYSLTDYSVSVYFMVHNSKTNLSANGNFIYTFSNSDSALAHKNGYIFGRATRATHNVSSQYYETGNMSTAGLSSDISAGLFHHFVYTQKGATGTAYLDGKAISTMPAFTNLPFDAVAKPEFTGTRFNWLGRSNYIGDVYLSNTWLADFQLYKKALSVDEVTSMQTKRKNLNLAYIKDSVPELFSEWEALNIDNLDNINTDVILPSNGILEPAVSITWTSSFPAIISNTGVVNRPEHLDTKVILTATLTLNGQVLTKEFTANVLAAPCAPCYTSDLILNYNFASSSDDIVMDVTEKHFSGTLKKGARVKTIGPAGNKHNVLDLPSDTAYFDMGIDCGKLIYSLNDYSVSVYFLVDTAKTNLYADGNIIYSFSNSDSSNIKKNGYLFGRATNIVHGVTSASSTSGILKTAASGEPTKGVFHHMVFTQKGQTGTTYLDGETVSSLTSFTNLPSITLPRDDKTGTLYNWLGRSSNLGEAYLGKAMIADFQLYKKALTLSQIDSMQFKTRSLNAAYNGQVSVAQAKIDKGLKIDNSTPGLIRIIGQKDGLKMRVFDLLGRLIVETDKHEISLNRGIYIVVSEDESKAKVWVY